jgi:parvulin-like peptidyl-prolyl isomerase
MVMNAMREKTKLVFFLLLLAFVGFVFFDWGMQGGGGNRGPNAGAIGRVNGKDISYDEYMRARQQLVSSFESRTGKPPETSDYDAIEEETWNQVVRDKIILQQIEKHGIKATDGDPNFDWLPVEQYLKASLPASKLENYVALNARVTRGEVRARFNDDNEKVRVRFVRSFAPDVANLVPSVDEAEARAYYDAHPDEFRAEERAVLEYVRFQKSATPEDSAFVRDELEDVRRMVTEEGKDFAELAKTWSEDASAERGGDLGFFGRGDMVPEFEEAVFALSPGQVSPVFATQWGYQIVKVEEKKTEGGKEKVRARHMLMKIEPSNASVRAQESATEVFLTAIQGGKSFADAAAAQNLVVDRTPAFERGAFVPGIGAPRLAARFAFSAQVGEVRPEPLEDDRAFTCIRLAERTPPGVLPFEEAKAEADRLALDAKRKEAARKRLEDAVANGEGTLEGIAKAIGGSIDTAAAFSRNSFVPGVGRKTEFVAAAFAVPVGEISKIVRTDTGFAVLEVREKIPADEAVFAGQEAQLRQQLLLEKRRNLVTSWLEDLFLKAEIVDLRSGSAVPWKPDLSEFRYVREAGV